MSVRSIANDIYYVGVNDWDRQVFDALIPLPTGTSYNSYIVKGSQKVALVDTVEPEKVDEFLSNLSELKLSRIDYIVIDHAEQDHSGLIGRILEMYPDAMIVTNAKCKELLVSFHILEEDKFIIVSDGETLSLGNKTLEFIIAPWVHWPDTMFTYVREDKVMFTTDFFGAHISDSSLFVENECKVYDAAKRYYAQIMMPFRNNVKLNLQKVEKFDVKVIGPSHGQIYNKPEFIMDAYRDWSSDSIKNEVVIPFVSMHGSTKKMVEILIESLIKRNIKVKPFNLETADLGELAMACVDAATIVLASPAVLLGPHPKAAYAAYLVNALKPKTKYLALISSFGWGCKIEENIKQMLGNLKVEILETTMVKGYPKENDFENIEKLAQTISLKHRELGLV